MRAIQVTCPNCGATLRVADAATAVQCEYCGTPSAVQRRTRILERVIAPAQPNLPRAVQRHTKTWLVISLLAIAVPMLGLVCVTNRATSTRVSVSSSTTTTTTSTTTTTRRADAPSWQGTDNVLVVDVTGDGTPELVGRGRLTGERDAIMLIALDVATGKLLWTGDTLGTYSDTYTGSLTLAGDTLLFATQTGELRGYALLGGKLRWKTQLDERAKYICATRDPGVVDIVGADDVVRPVVLLDGKLGTTRPAPQTRRREDLCPRLANDDTPAYDLAKQREEEAGEDKNALGNRLGFYVDGIVRGPGGRVLSGSRMKGTQLTLIAALDDSNAVRWQQTASDGLGATGAPRKLVVGEREVCIIYYEKDYMTACFALADGRRLWSAKAPSFFEELVIIGRSLVVTGNELRVHDLDTGKVRWTY